VSDDAVYRVNDPNVTSEEIDGEVIIVNLLNGNYYSAVDLAACLWVWIQDEKNAGQMCDELIANFAEHSDSIKNDVSRFLTNLENESLVVKRSGGEAKKAASEPGNAIDVKLPETYTAPELSSYSDMQDLLLLDPIHDVADVGWPTAKNESDS
jgi:hypothetical protein